jgi:hypothetical protein
VRLLVVCLLMEEPVGAVAPSEFMPDFTINEFVQNGTYRSHVLEP